MEKKKILLIKLGAIGDVVHSTVIPNAIKTAHPNWEIHYMTIPSIAKILRNNDFIDKVIEYKNNEKSEFFYLIKVAAELRKEHYDTVFCLSHTIKLFLLSFGAFPKRIGFRVYSKGSWVEDYFLSAKKIFKDIELPKELVLKTNPDSERKIEEKMGQYPKPYIVISPGKIHNQLRQGRVWNISKWKALGKNLVERYGGTVFVIGSYSEKNYHEQLNGENIVILSGGLALDESCAVLSKADVVISGDSGPVHIASAFGVPTVAILGSTSPDKIKPYGENGYFIEPKTDCRYCWKKKCKYLNGKDDYTPCIESISVDMVLEKIEEIGAIKRNKNINNLPTKQAK